MSRYRMAAILAALVLLFGLAGHMDYEDQQAEQERYCEMVKGGYWPDAQERATLSPTASALPWSTSP